MNPHDRLMELLAADDPPLDLCLLLVSEALSSNPKAVDEGMAALDSLADAVTEPTVERVLNHIFGVESFVGDIDDYHAPENSFLDLVIKRRRGMPITLAAVLICVGTRVGVGLHGVGLPGHFLVGIEDSPGTFVDPFAGGVRLDLAGVENRYRRLFGDDSMLDPGLLRPVGTAAIVGRVLNNLVRTFAERDPVRLDPLIELRVGLPGPPEEQQLLIRLAEARGKWDRAAGLREAVDPDDPVAVRLRSRLN